MTRKQLAKEVEKWRKIIVPESKIYLRSDIPEHLDENNVWGVCETIRTKDVATIGIPDGTLEEDASTISVTIIHELLHVLVNRLTEQIDNIEEHLSKSEFAIFKSNYSITEEKIVERLAIDNCSTIRYTI